MARNKTWKKPELVIKTIDGMDVIMGFTGTISKRMIPGVNIPRSVMAIFRVASPGTPATFARVCLINDQDVWYAANVTRSGLQQSIVAAPVSECIPDKRFPPGTRVFVRRA